MGEYDELLEETIQYFEESMVEEVTKEADPEYGIRRGKGKLLGLKNGSQKSLSLLAGTSPWDQLSGKRRMLRYAMQMKPSAIGLKNIDV